MRIKCGRMLGMVNKCYFLLVNRHRPAFSNIQIRIRGRRNAVFEHAVYMLTRRTLSAFIIRELHGFPRLLQLRWWRAVEHLALRTLEQIKRIGFDDKRTAHPLEFRDTLDARKVICKVPPFPRPRLGDIEQLAGKQRRIRLGHVDPADALRWLHHATAFRQIECEPAGGAVVRHEHARSAGPNARRLDSPGKLAPSNADAANGGVAMIASECPGVGLHNQYRKHQEPNRRRPAQAKIGYAPRAFLPWREMGGDPGGNRENRIYRREPVGFDPSVQRVPHEIERNGPEG